MLLLMGLMGCHCIVCVFLTFEGVKTVVVCSKRELLVAGSEDGLIIVWSLSHLGTLHTLSGHTGWFLAL